jgi:hypothetical protein
MATKVKKTKGRPATKAKPAKSPKVYSVIVQNWEESDSWSGPSDDGFTLHLTVEACKAYAGAFWKDQRARLGEATPEAYTRTCGGPRPIDVNAKIYRKLVKHKDKNGLWGKGDHAPAHLLKATDDVNSPG